jgi:hypothetical protein
MNPQRMIVILRHPERFTDDERRAARLLASDLVEGKMLSLRERANACQEAIHALRGPWGSSDEAFDNARCLAANLIAVDLQPEIEREIEFLTWWASTRYVLQPPIFKSTKVARDKVVLEGGRVFISGGAELFFGFPGTSLGEALIRVLRIRQATGEDVQVGAKAKESDDEIFSSLHEHLGHECLPRLFDSAVAFSNLDGYATVYCQNPRILLQPRLRRERGLREYPVPSRECHRNQASQIRAFLQESALSPDAAGTER